MNGSRNCGNCKFWERISGAGGECHFNPPQAIAAPIFNKLTNQQALQAISYWPPVDEAKACGRHETDYEA